MSASNLHAELVHKIGLLAEDKRDAAITKAMEALEKIRPVQEITPDPLHFAPAHNRTLVFRHKDKAAIMIDFVDGTVALAENLTEDAAAALFWNAVRKYDDGEPASQK